MVKRNNILYICQLQLHTRPQNLDPNNDQYASKARIHIHFIIYLRMTSERRILLFSDLACF